ncbi:hypothetical protein K5L04_10405 [Flavobacterium psychrophilum]|uniref:hypothetical protein n=1 Tax=Flavobacterium psychrophilum TaxID=96345 RepID=UPI001C8F3071|nr:hypothetical protein [Flavobacterium psychrophilum]QZL00104.1 hypothetical protein K5L04_10405 [Flavobacterium psychrophilum]
MQIEDLEAMLPNFSNEMLQDFKTNQKEFKALSVQKHLQMIDRSKKVNSNIAKTEKFWFDVNSNMELFRQRVINEIDNVIKANFTDKQKADYFFEYIEKETF